VVRDVDEQGVVGLTALHGNEVEAGASDLQLGGAVDRDVGFEARDIVQLEALAEKPLGELLRGADRA